MTRYIKVTPEQVEAARIHVQAYRSAGIDPDPLVRRMAQAEARSQTWVDQHDRQRIAERTNARRLEADKAAVNAARSAAFPHPPQAAVAPAKPGTARDDEATTRRLREERLARERADRNRGREL
ncbi:hypothetical protein [Modestobacter sp. I12A-02662]|uniref:hypothetical protein n=1 Tax=Modestobacter sp. I12A-02662 TaxID=1730496 RepID=UPI0034DFF168